MSSYAERQAARRERLEAAADRAAVASGTTYLRARTMASAIPFGQPILVGHYSEGRDRRYRARIHNTFGKAFAMQDQAQDLARRAAAVGTGGISSDDPEAIAKLHEQLAAAEASQVRMKAVNKAIRANKTPEARVAALVAQGFTQERATEMLRPDFCGRIGFPGYALSNNNANIRRIEGRIAELEAAARRVDVEQAGNGYTYREDTDENRVMFLFDCKPDEQTRAVLKANAFKWSPTRGAWVRQLNNAGIYAGKCVREALDEGAK